MEYNFRSCTLKDLDFLFNLKKENFKWYVDKIWGWNDENQKERLRQDLKEHLAHKRIILLDNKEIVVYAVHTTENGDLKGATIYVSCEPCMMCMGAILYEEFSKIVYAATLQDSNDNYYPEMITDIDVLAKYGNIKIEIVKELHRDKAVDVLRMKGEA